MKNNNDEYFYINGRHYDYMIKSRQAYDSVPFYINCAKRYGSPVLELACGTGRITLPIAREGLSVIGLDFSEKMLDQARRKTEDINLDIEWVQGDMINFSLNKKFCSIIMPGAAMNWIVDNRNIKNCLINVRKHLKKNGRFIFDVFNPDLDILQRESSNIYPMYNYPNPDGEGTISVTGSNSYDKASQINYFNSYYNFKDKEIVKELKLRMIFPQELDALLYYNGFKIDNKFGTFAGEPFKSDSNSQIIICHKK